MFSKLSLEDSFGTGDLGMVIKRVLNNVRDRDSKGSSTGNFGPFNIYFGGEEYGMGLETLSSRFLFCSVPGAASQ